ncbi:MAG: DUF2309 domain-containing protein [Pseudomonadota bacterium]
MPANPSTTAATHDDAELRHGAPALRDALDRAARKVAPVWPLRHFVAVNPYLGVAERGFAEAGQILGRAAGTRVTMPRAHYTDAIASGRITDADLGTALDAAQSTGSALAAELPRDVAAIRAALAANPTSAPLTRTPCVADAAATATGKDWGRLVVERLSLWAAGYFDEGQASWRQPGRDLAPYAAWRAAAVLDRTPEIMGIKGFRQTVRGLPANAADAAEVILDRLGVPSAGLDAYLHRLVMSFGGWSAYARYRVWQAELYGGGDDAHAEVLVARLAWDLAILEGLRARGVAQAWDSARSALAAPVMTAADTDIAIDVLLQTALEHAWQRGLAGRFPVAPAAAVAERPKVQAAFCIDVRSEVFRRALESADREVETIGFAGFFGFPIEYVLLGHDHGGAQCPVLLTPTFVVREAVEGASETEEVELLGLRMLRRRAAKAWKSFKREAVSSFGFVETVGLAFGGKLATDSLRLTRTVVHPSADGLDQAVVERLGPRLTPQELAGRIVGFPPAERLAMAGAVLGAMSMTEGFGRLVLLAGHGSTTVNNPHATGLDCGACGGHTGEANARVAAAILNDPDVRAGLVEKGTIIPDDTVFLGALHDTTTDEVVIFDQDTVPASHRDDLERLLSLLEEAGRRSRAERAAWLSLEEGRPVDTAVLERSRDWSQVRPEWGLAGCAAFIAAPRHRTHGTDLGGRSFLHSYEWRKDDGFGVLELIMTAPMVVASWISLQYYGSTVDNEMFGSGNKVLHNVVGTLGVLEGNGGDLRVGLPWQSVHDGERLIHEPLRLSVVIEAPTEAMNAVIAKHDAVRQLVDNGWLHLFQMNETGAVAQRYTGSLTWIPLAGGTASMAA